MLRLIGLLIRLAIFSAFVLILGNWVKWDGKTISDQVRIGMSHAEETDVIEKIRGWAQQVTHDAHKGFRNKLHRTEEDREEIPASERQKLKALIRELNSARSTD